MDQPNSTIESDFSRRAFGCAGLSVLVLAALVIVGWFSGQRTLVQVMPGWVPMQFNTALGFALCGGAVLALATGRLWMTGLLSIVVALLGGATLSQMVFGFNLGIDNAFINHYITDATSSPGRMAPGTAIGLIVTAACLLLKTSVKRELWRIILAQCLAATSGGMALAAVVTYITGGDRTFLWGSMTEMAIHTAIGFTILSSAIVLRSWSHVERDPAQGNGPLVGLLTLCGLVLLIDSLAPLGIATGVLYVMPLLVSLRSSSERDTIIVACVGVVGTVLGYFFFSPVLDAPLWAVLCNRALAILAIFMVTLLTVQIRRMHRVEEERDELTQAVDAMEQVMGVVGHELRTPLAAVRASAELVLTNFTKPEDESHIFIQTIHDEIIRMAEMVNNLLEAARLNNGSARWNWGEVKINTACEEALSIIRPLLDQSRIDLSLKVTPPDLTMLGDAEAVRRLLVNFVSNSAKHTSNGSIIIEADATTTDGRHWIRLRIRDTGEGISENIREKLGRAFVLSNGVIGSDYVKGAGLGLSICRAIVGVHGGSINVHSEPVKGSEFTILLRADLCGPIQPQTDNNINWGSAA